MRDAKIRGNTLRSGHRIGRGSEKQANYRISAETQNWHLNNLNLSLALNVVDRTNSIEILRVKKMQTNMENDHSSDAIVSK